MRKRDQYSLKRIGQRKMLSKDLLDKMAKAKAEIQFFQLWVDDARTNRIARIRYGKAKDKLKELVAEHKSLMEKWLKERIDEEKTE